MRIRQWSVLAVAVAMVACGAGDDAADDQAAIDSANAAAPSAPAPAPMGDAEVAHVVWTVNGGEIEGGGAAATKATNAEVKAFAQMVMKDHTTSQTEVEALAQKLGVTPAENLTSTQVKGDHDRAMGELAALSGAAYDRAFIAHEVAMHQAVLNAIDQQLMSAVQNEELRAALVKTRPVVEMHLQTATAILAKLPASGS